MTNTLRIERLATTCLVPRDHPSPTRLHAQINDLARSHIADCCSRAIGAVLDPADPSVWVIDEINLDLLLDVHSAPPVEIAEFWARKIAGAVARVISEGEDGGQVLRFANRAAFLAHFLRYLAEDRAWQKWYFKEFESLRSLPHSAAIREALVREPTIAEEVLLELSRTQVLGVVAAVLSRADEESIVARCAGGAIYAADALRVVLRVNSARSWADTSLTALYMRIRSECPSMAPARAAGAADHLERIFNWRRTGRLRSVFHSLRGGSTPSWELSSDELATLAILRDIVAGGGFASLVPLLANSQRGDAEDKEIESELGGVFLLTVVLLETPALLDIFGGTQSALQRYLLYVTCLYDRFSGAWADPALRCAAGLSEAPSDRELAGIKLPAIPAALRELALPEDIAYFAAQQRQMLAEVALDPVQHSTACTYAAILLREFARRLPALAGSSIEYLRRNFLTGPAWIAVTPDLISVRLKRRPLQIVLQMAGLHGRTLELPGCAPKSFIVRFDET